MAFNVPHLTREQYLTELTNIYNSESNFMIYKPKIVPIDIHEYENPFRVLKKTEIREYITSKDYWANDVAIEAICDKLKISVIPIEKYEYERTSGRIQLKRDIVNRLKALLINNQLLLASLIKRFGLRHIYVRCFLR